MRSKTLLVSNILSTIYAAVLLYIFGGGIVAAGGIDYIAYCRQYFSLAYELLGFSSLSMNVVYAIVILLLIHIVTFTLGVLFGWIGYSAKKAVWQNLQLRSILSEQYAFRFTFSLDFLLPLSDM